MLFRRVLGLLPFLLAGAAVCCTSLVAEAALKYRSLEAAQISTFASQLSEPRGIVIEISRSGDTAFHGAFMPGAD